MKGALIIMRRTNPPFNGKQFVLNLSTGEVHDLDHETPSCHIDDMSLNNVKACDSYLQAEIAGALCSPTIKVNGCHFCNSAKDIG